MEWRELPRKERGVAVLAGVFLALHFATWIGSLSYSSVAASVVLVNTTPIWVGLLTPFLSKDRITRPLAVGIAIAFLGALAIVVPDLEADGHSWIGDLLATAGAIFAAFYLLSGRKARARFSIQSYLLLCYTTAALTLFVLVLALDVPLTVYSTETWGWIALLALIPQMIGHSTFNWALRWLSAAVISVSLLVEPILSTLLAWLTLGEVPTGATILGGLLILSGVWIVSRGEKKEPSSEEGGS